MVGGFGLGMLGGWVMCVRRLFMVVPCRCAVRMVHKGSHGAFSMKLEIGTRQKAFPDAAPSRSYICHAMLWVFFESNIHKTCASKGKMRTRSPKPVKLVQNGTFSRARKEPPAWENSQTATSGVPINTVAGFLPFACRFWLLDVFVTSACLKIARSLALHGRYGLCGSQGHPRFG